MLLLQEALAALESVPSPSNPHAAIVAAYTPAHQQFVSSVQACLKRHSGRGHAILPPSSSLPPLF